MDILIACEESQRVCIEFRKLGHNAFSCDIVDCSGGYPEYHIKSDVIPLLNGFCNFETCDNTKHILTKKWDLIIAHPPCTYLTVSGNRWFNVERYGEKAIERINERNKSIVFFMNIVNANCNKIAIENPIGVMSTYYRKPDQIIQPYYFGHNARKSTCLWLKNLPLLNPTNIVSPGIIDKYGCSVGASATYARDEKGKILAWNDPLTAKIRSKTFFGIAKAMAKQWGN